MFDWNSQHLIHLSEDFISCVIVHHVLELQSVLLVQ